MCKRPRLRAGGRRARIAADFSARPRNTGAVRSAAAPRARRGEASGFTASRTARRRRCEISLSRGLAPVRAAFFRSARQHFTARVLHRCGPAQGHGFRRFLRHERRPSRRFGENMKRRRQALDVRASDPPRSIIVRELRCRRRVPPHRSRANATCRYSTRAHVWAVVDRSPISRSGMRSRVPRSRRGLRARRRACRACSAGGRAQAGHAEAPMTRHRREAAPPYSSSLPCHVEIHCLSAISACCGRGTRARAVNTSWPLRSMRCSVSKYTDRMISAATRRLRSSGGSAVSAR